MAQEADEKKPTVEQKADETDIDIEDDEDDDGIEEIVVTGSRIRRTEFSSASPIQIISGEISREIGLFDAKEMLQSSVQATGTKIDNTFNGYVLDNGVGAATISFRGLGAGRTLVMINGRRISSSGVGGAPVAPDLNLIPSLMINRIENLLDGASAVYGSDAIAGVSNVILRKDFDGLEVKGNIRAPFEGGGETYSLGAIWGKTWDNANLTIGAEYFKRDAIKYSDRSFLNHCNEYYYEDPKGNILSNAGGYWPRASASKCKSSGLINYAQLIRSQIGYVFYKKGSTNVKIPNFNAYRVTAKKIAFLAKHKLAFPGTKAYDSNGDGVIDEKDSHYFDGNNDNIGDVDFLNPFHNSSDSKRAYAADFFSGFERYSVMASGDYGFEDDNDTTAFFEFLFSSRAQHTIGRPAQLFPVISKNNPTNPCSADYGGKGKNAGCHQSLGLGGGFFNVQPVVSIIGDRSVNDVKVTNMRSILGLKGSIPFIKDSDWRYETYFSYSRSRGTQKSEGILKDKLMHSLDTTRWDPKDPTKLICGNGKDGCVVVNMFADSIFKEGGGHFATQAERDYVFGKRYFETIITQKMAGLTVDGNLFSLPWNDTDVPLVMGYEYRSDSIKSNPNSVASEGKLIHYFKDKGADGTSHFNEFFAETQLNLIQDKTLIEELTISGAVRYTKPSFYDGATTYNVKGIYRPFEWLTFRGTYGTSYRAPNLREQFIHGTSGFGSIFDPCVIPDKARVAGSLSAGSVETYDKDEDKRIDRVKAACLANGVDPTKLGLTSKDGAWKGSHKSEIVTGGADDITEETSRSFTYGIVFDQPWSDDFRLTASITYYNIEIKNTINEPGTGSIFNKCYNNIDEPNATSPYCKRIKRDSNGKVILVDTSFINIGRKTSEGIDLNLLYQQDFEVDSKTLGVTLDLKSSHLKETLVEVEKKITYYQGRPTYPHWRVQGRLSLSYDDFRFTWFSIWLQGGENKAGKFTDGRPCFDKSKGIKCRPVYYTKNYIMHNTSLTWRPGDYSVTVGINNVFNKVPEKIDTSGVSGRRNFPLGIGYDVYGRSIYVTATKRF